MADMEACKRPRYLLKGSYLDELIAYPLEESEKKNEIIIDEDKMPFEIWKAIDSDTNQEESYFFTKFTIMLNNLTT